jgi:hypothetical protein
MRLIAAAACLAFVALATGCTATVEPTGTAPPPVLVESTGTLTVDWSINGTKDPNQCSQGAAAAIQISVTDSSGISAGTYQQSCSTFATSITLSAGSYTADAMLIDSAGAPRTTTVPMNPFTIRGNDVLDTPIDFPAASFF